MSKRFLLAVACIATILQAQDVMSSPEPFADSLLKVTDGTLFKGGFSPDGDSFYFFRKVSDEAEDYRIFVIHQTDGAWGPATQVDLGGEHSDLYPTISPDNDVLVFSSYRPVPGNSEPAANANLWRSHRTNDGWGPPELLDEISTLENYDAGATYAPDGNLYFSSTSADWSETTLYKVDVVDRRLSGSRFEIDTSRLASWRTDELYFWGATLSARQDYWILEYSPLGEDGRPGPSDLYYAKRTGDRWGDPRPIAHGVNLPDSTENFVISGPDGQELYFVRDFNSYYSISLHDALNQTRETASENAP